MRKSVTGDELRERVKTSVIPEDPRQAIDEFQAAKFLGVSVFWMRRARWAGGGPEFNRIGGRRLYTMQSLEAFRNGCTHNSTSDPNKAA
jgi:hypothetical protein